MSEDQKRMQMNNSHIVLAGSYSLLVTVAVDDHGKSIMFQLQKDGGEFMWVKARPDDARAIAHLINAVLSTDQVVVGAGSVSKQGETQ